MNGSSFLHFILERRLELLDNTLEHLFLTGVSMLFAVLAGIPLGIVAFRSLWWRRFILPAANMIQTIPSLAMLAFLLPLLGIGVKPALTALIFYALLPVIRNTYTGLAEIPAAVLQAADGLGFSSWQRLWIIEMPLAVPVIMAGIRTATVICVGIATLSAFIGAGGLGEFINRGLAINSTYLILLGAIPSALLALLLDGLIGWVEAKISWKKVMQS